MPLPQAKMGYVGSVTFLGTTGGNIRVRATSADVRASQEITYPDVVDGKIDRTLYQLGPRIVEGNVSFPLVHEGGSILLPQGKSCNQTTGKAIGATFWEMGVVRDPFGRLINEFDTQIRYTDDTGYVFPSCIVNTLTMSVTQSDVVNVSMDLIGGASGDDNVRRDLGQNEVNPNILSPARVVTWNDFLLRIFGESGELEAVRGDYVRNFEVTVNNNAERFFTLNNRLAPQDITAKKREVSGSIVLMGRVPGLSELAYNNQQRFTSTSSIHFGYSLGGGGAVAFATALHGVIFEMEEIAITNELVETTVNYGAMGDCDNGFETMEIGNTSALAETPSEALASNQRYGGRASVGFPNWSPDD